MSSRPWDFKPSQIQRAIRSVQRMGLPISAIEVTKDRINVKVGVGDKSETMPSEELEKWLTAKNAR